MSRRWVRGLTLKILYPLLMLAGSFMKNKKEAYQKFIINFNNKLVKRERPKTKKILLLLPHCLQIDKCAIRLTYNIYNCEGCGRCEIKDLIQIADENHLKLFVATGGSLARRIINEIKPEAVVAVACENDLSSGIVDTYPLPILGITNERPFGPCLNTKVDLAKVKEAIEFFGKVPYN
ncbi:MAG: DUF116 domain-containing protein [Nitrospirota bacterium]|nr:DUF116 domain-containing protein [Nitrospirota bacterium]